MAAELSVWVVECVTIAIDQDLGAAADPVATVVSSMVTPLLGLTAVVIAVPGGVSPRRM